MTNRANSINEKNILDECQSDKSEKPYPSIRTDATNGQMDKMTIKTTTMTNPLGQSLAYDYGSNPFDLDNGKRLPLSSSLSSSSFKMEDNVKVLQNQKDNNEHQQQLVKETDGLHYNSSSILSDSGLGNQHQSLVTPSTTLGDISSDYFPSDSIDSYSSSKNDDEPKTTEKSNRTPTKTTNTVKKDKNIKRIPFKPVPLTTCHNYNRNIPKINNNKKNMSPIKVPNSEPNQVIQQPQQQQQHQQQQQQQQEPINHNSIKVTRAQQTTKNNKSPKGTRRYGRNRPVPIEPIDVSITEGTFRVTNPIIRISRFTQKTEAATATVAEKNQIYSQPLIIYWNEQARGPVPVSSTSHNAQTMCRHGNCSIHTPINQVNFMQSSLYFLVDHNPNLELMSEQSPMFNGQTMNQYHHHHHRNKPKTN